MTFKQNWFAILLLVTCALFSGCVGEIQQAAEDKTLTNESPRPPLSFQGVFQAKAISQDKAEIFFYPAQGGSGDYTYIIFIGDNPFPVSVPGDLLVPDYRGLLRHTITGLSRFTSYAIRVEAEDDVTDALSTSGVSQVMTTFANEVANFNGISAVSNMPGQDGKDSIKVRFGLAAVSGGIVQQDWDPKKYEIVMVDADRLTPADMDNTSFNASTGRWVFELNHDDTVNEYVARGLPSDTKFYVRVRAIHKASVDDIYNPALRGELNTKYAQIATLSEDLADLNFDPASFLINNNSGLDVLTSMLASWPIIQGVFDHFRVYYAEEGFPLDIGTLPTNCLSPSLAPPGTDVFCKKLPYTAASTVITGLTSYTNYNFRLVICQTSGCEENKRLYSDIKSGSTNPSVASFTGLLQTKRAQNLDQLGKVFLEYAIPDFSNGYFDGLKVEMRRTVDGSDSPVVISETNPSGVTIDAFNYLTQNQITVNNIDYLAPEPYCFTIYPFNYTDAQGSATVDFQNNIWRCFYPEIKAPELADFPGITQGAISEYNAVEIFWDTPVKGVYSHIEIFWRKNSPAFNFATAIDQTSAFNYTNYGRMVVPGDQMSAVVSSLPDGTYAFGVLTYYSYISESGSAVVRSESNNGIFTCVVAAGVSSTCTPQ